MATSLTWNGGAGTSAPADGGGTWDASTTSDWWNGTSTQPYATTSVSQVSTTTNGSTTLTLTTANSTIAVGDAVSGTGIAAGTVVTAVSGTTVTLSNKATATASTNSINFGSVAYFGAGSGAAGTVTVNGTVGGSGLVINPAGSGNYTFTPGSGTSSITLTNAGLLVDASSATINVPIYGFVNTFVGDGQILTLGDGGGVSGGVTVLSGTLTPLGTGSTGTLNLSGGKFVTGGNPILALGKVGPTINAANIGVTTGVVGGLELSGTGTLQVGGSFGVGFGTQAVITLNGNSDLIMTNGSSMNISRLGNTARAIVNSGTINLSSTGSGIGLGIGTNSAGELDVLGGTITGAVANWNPITVNNGAITGTGNLFISGGNISVSSIVLGGAGAYTTGSANVLMTGGSLFLGSTSSTFTTTNLSQGIFIPSTGITGAFTPSVTLSGGTIGANTAWNTSVPMTLGTTNGNITFEADNNAGTANNITLNGAFSGSGGMNITGLGTVTLGSANSSWTGGTVINGGNAKLGAGTTGATGALGATTNALAIKNAGTLDLAGFSDAVGAVTMGSGGSTISDSGAAATLTATSVSVSGANNTIGAGVTVSAPFTQSTFSALTVNGNIGNDSMGAGATLNGTGSTSTVTLNGSNGLSSAGTLSTAGVAVNGTNNTVTSGTITGPTTFSNSSSLLINSGATLSPTEGITLAATSTLTVNGVAGPVTSTAGGTLSGIGSVGATNLTGPGGVNLQDGGVGTLTASSMSLNTTTLALDIDSDTATADKVAVTGALTLSNVTLSLDDLGSTNLAAGTTFSLAGYSTLSGTFNGLADGSLITLGTNTFQINYGTLSGFANQVTLEDVAVVPEPSTWAMLASGAAILLFLQHRRRSQS